MKKPEIEEPFDLPDSLWEALNERLWHATSPKGLKGILEAGKIKIGQRYENSLCRHQGYVSLFDFGSTAKDCSGQYRNWWEWFGHQQESRVAVWLEIDRDAASRKVYNAGKMYGIWQDNLGKGGTVPGLFIPGVEAGHKGPVPVDVLKGALLIYQHDLNRFERFDEVDECLVRQIVDFEKRLPPPASSHSIIGMFDAARNQ